MKEELLNHPTQSGLTPLPAEALLEILELAQDWQVFQQEPVEPVSEAFLQRCDHAGELAFALLQLSQAYGKAGFLPQTLKQRFEGLATAASVSLKEMLAYCGISELEAPVSETWPGWLRLGQKLGISLREMLIYFRLSLLEQYKTPLPATLLLRQRADGPVSSPLEASEARLAQLEQQIDPPVRAELKRLTTAFKAAWDENAPEAT